MPTSPEAQLVEEIAKLKEFSALLQREQELLARADVEALLPLIENKNTIAGQLAEFSRVRELALQSLQLPPGRTGMNAWLDRSGKTTDRKAWQQLIDLAVQVRTLNETNGKLIKLHMQHNQQAFNALMAAANRAVTYGPDGQQQHMGSSRILGTA